MVHGDQGYVDFFSFFFWHRVTHRNQAKNFPFTGLQLKSDPSRYSHNHSLFVRARYSKELAHTSSSMANVASHRVTVGRKRKCDALFLLSINIAVSEDGVRK